jgi:hypothetical protein
MAKTWRKYPQNYILQPNTIPEVPGHSETLQLLEIRIPGPSKLPLGLRIIYHILSQRSRDLHGKGREKTCLPLPCPSGKGTPCKPPPPAPNTVSWIWRSAQRLKLLKYINALFLCAVQSHCIGFIAALACIELQDPALAT